MATITAGSWQGRLDAGLPRRQLEAFLLAANDMTHKEIARQMGIAHLLSVPRHEIEISENVARALRKAGAAEAARMDLAEA